MAIVLTQVSSGSKPNGFYTFVRLPDGSFAAAGGSRDLYSAPATGLGWTLQQAADNFTIAYNGTNVVGRGASFDALYSANGLSYSAVAMPNYLGANGSRVVWTGTEFYMTAGSANGNLGNVSATGTSWSGSGTPPISTLGAMCYDGARIIAFGTGGSTNWASTPNPATAWTNHGAMPVTSAQHAVSNGAGVTIAAFSSNGLWRLVGTTWTECALPPGADTDSFTFVVWNEITEQFAANGRYYFVYSDDGGITWEATAFPWTNTPSETAVLADGTYMVYAFGTSGAILHGVPEVPPEPGDTEIVFLPLLASPHTDSEGDALLPALSTFGSELPNVGLIDLPGLLTSGLGVNNLHGMLSLPGLEIFGAEGIAPVVTYLAYGAFMLPALTTFGTSVADDMPTPQDAQGVFELPGLTTYGEGFMHYDAEGLIDLPPFAAFGFETGGDGYGFATLPPLSTHAAEEVTTPDTYIFGMVDGAGWIIASNTMLLEAEFGMNDSTVNELIYMLESRIQLNDQLRPLMNLLTTLQSSFVARDFMQFVIETTLTSPLELDDEAIVTVEAIMALASQLIVQDETINWMSAVTVVTSALVLRASVRASMGQTLASTIDFADAIEANQTLIMMLISEVITDDEIGTGFLATALITSDVAFAAGLSGVMAMQMLIESGVIFATRLRTPDGGVFAGYAMNLRNAAVSTLTNYPFTSFASVQRGGRHLTLATGPNGVYQLGGDTDAGDPIQARVRTGLSDFGTSQLKRFANGYIGYTSDGELKLVAITTDGGRKKENWYRLRPRSADAPVDGRFDIAKGLTARYWGWQVENIDGADFTLADLKVAIALLQRRKSGR